MDFFSGLKKLEYVRRLFGEGELPNAEEHFRHILALVTPEQKAQRYVELVLRNVRLQKGFSLTLEDGLPRFNVQGMGEFGVAAPETSEGLWFTGSSEEKRSNGFFLALAWLADDDVSRADLFTQKMTPGRVHKHVAIEAVGRLAAIGLNAHTIEAIGRAAKFPVSVPKVWQVIERYELVMFEDGLEAALQGWMISQGWSASLRQQRYALVTERVTELARLRREWNEAAFDIYN